MEEYSDKKSYLEGTITLNEDDQIYDKIEILYRLEKVS